MHIDMTAAIEQIKIKGRDTFSSFLDKLLKERNIIRQNNKERVDISELLENLRSARQEWVIANTNYEFAKEEELIDYYTYAIKAAQIKYDYLIKKIKEKNINMTREDFYEIGLEKNQGIFNYLK